MSVMMFVGATGAAPPPEEEAAIMLLRRMLNEVRRLINAAFFLSRS